MTGKLKDYQVLDVLGGGTFYKVRHKVTGNIFAWRAYNCSAYSDDQIQNIVEEARTVSCVKSRNLLRYYDSIVHAPSRTLYFVLEYSGWRSLEELLSVCEASGKRLAESFVWRLLHELARLCNDVDRVHLVVLKTCITPASIFVGENCELRVNCFDLNTQPGDRSVMRQVGVVIHTLCFGRDELSDGSQYSDDIRDIVHFLTDDRTARLSPDVIVYHPTVLANLETLSGPKHISEILVPLEHSPTSEVNKCDSEKAVEQGRNVEPAPRSLLDSPIYLNISPKSKLDVQIEDASSPHLPMSPTLAALALELPGFVPRCRKPYNQALDRYNPRLVSEETLGQQWMSRLVAIREREASLNKRERELIAKEIVNSPATKMITQHKENGVDSVGNGITLPPEICQPLFDDKQQWVSRRRYRRGSVRAKARRKSCGYEDLDSSLSADAGDGSIVVTAAKITKQNMPRRNIFPDVASKKVHFTSTNPFAESDESVTLTFYELENVDVAGYQVPRQEEKVMKDITRFKYLDLDKVTSEKRAAMQQWTHSSPSKQAKFTKKIFSDITNTSEGIRRTPSKVSVNSKGSSTSRCSVMSSKSQVSECEQSEGSVSVRTRSSVRQSLAPTSPVPMEAKKKSRKSLLSFKTPFKFMTSTKI